MITTNIDIMLSRPGLYVIVAHCGVAMCEVDEHGKCYQLKLSDYTHDGELLPGNWFIQNIIGLLGPFARQASTRSTT